MAMSIFGQIGLADLVGYRTWGLETQLDSLNLVFDLELSGQGHLESLPTVSHTRLPRFA
jgi:hypothetical protein